MSGQNIMQVLTKDSRLGDLQEIFKTFLNAGHEIYLVGGCVRDALLGREIYDYDFATSALPDQTQALFAKTLDHGKSFGTITVVLNQNHYEVTTFRSDMNYNDHRRPQSVNFSNSLKEDSQRRDFTINALYVDHKGDVIDPQNGLQSLHQRTLTCVGGHTLEGARERFQEDALRMFRALRFAAQLNFKIEDTTFKALLELWPLTQHLSKERRHQEFKKMVEAFYFKEVLELICAHKLGPLKIQSHKHLDQAVGRRGAVASALDILKRRLDQEWEELRFKIFILEIIRMNSHHLHEALELLKELKAQLNFSKEEGKWLHQFLHILFDRVSVPQAVDVFLEVSALLNLEQMKSYFVSGVSLQGPLGEESFEELLTLLDQYEGQDVPKALIKAHDLMSKALQGERLGRALRVIYKHQIQTGITKKEDLLRWYFQNHQ